MDKFLEGFAFVWFVLVLMVNACVVVGCFWLEPTLWAGWKRFTYIYSPYTLSTFVINLVLASPAIGALAWVQRRERRRDRDAMRATHAGDGGNP